MIKVEYFGQELKVPDWTQWIMTDCNDEVWAYTDKPEYNDGVWNSGGESIRIYTYDVIEIPNNIEATLLNINDAKIIKETEGVNLKYLGDKVMKIRQEICALKDNSYSDFLKSDSLGACINSELWSAAEHLENVLQILVEENKDD